MVCITNIAYHWLYWSCVLLFAGLSFPECKLCEGRYLCFFCWLMCPSHLKNHFFLPQIAFLFLMKQYRFKTLFLIREELKCWPSLMTILCVPWTFPTLLHLGLDNHSELVLVGFRAQNEKADCANAHDCITPWCVGCGVGKCYSDFHHPDPKLFKFVHISLISPTSADTRVLWCFLPYIFPALSSQDSRWPVCDKTPK